MAAMMAAIGAGAAISNVLNDMLDAERDRLSGDTELLLATGVVGYRQAAATALILSATLIVLVIIASADFLSSVLSMITIALCAPLVAAYSYLKTNGMIAPVVGALVYVAAPVSAWLAAGAGGNPMLIAAVFAYALFFGFGSVVLATLRDVDSDGTVGVRSIAVRFGPGAALASAALADVVAQISLLTAATIERRLLVILPLALLSIFALTVAYGVTIRRQRDAAGRYARTSALRALSLVRLVGQLVLLAIFSVPLALVVGASLSLLGALLIFGYERRVFGGGLRASLERTLPAGELGTATRAFEPPALGKETP
jgi:4-hydroxybenzoate polyprenyltransferase